MARRKDKAERKEESSGISGDPEKRELCVSGISDLMEERQDTYTYMITVARESYQHGDARVNRIISPGFEYSAKILPPTLPNPFNTMDIMRIRTLEINVTHTGKMEREEACLYVPRVSTIKDGVLKKGMAWVPSKSSTALLSVTLFPSYFLCSFLKLA